MHKLVKLADLDDAQTTLTPTYAGRALSRPVPRFELAAEEMEPRAAYQLVHDQLKPRHESPTRTWRPSAPPGWSRRPDKLILESMRFNLANEEEYPHVIQIEERCVNMLARLFHAERAQEAVGVATIGFLRGGGCSAAWR